MYFAGSSAKMIKWKEDYSVRVSKIDEEHRKFLAIINDIIIAKQQHKEPEKVLEILREMTTYALNHFRTEEVYMLDFKYEDYEAHKKEHHDFSMKTVDYCNSVIKGDCQILDDLLKYLEVWLVHHIQETDKKYAHCFIENGLK